MVRKICPRSDLRLRTRFPVPVRIWYRAPARRNATPFPAQVCHKKARWYRAPPVPARGGLRHRTVPAVGRWRAQARWYRAPPADCWVGRRGTGRLWYRTVPARGRWRARRMRDALYHCSSPKRFRVHARGETRDLAGRTRPVECLDPRGTLGQSKRETPQHQGFPRDSST